MRGRHIFLLAILFSCISCLTDEKVSTSPQAIITSFTVGYYKVQVHDITKQGHDTVAYVRESGYMYPMTIDQLNNRIYNIDSLAYGSEVSRVTCSVYGSGTLFYSYADNPDVSYLWSGLDSIDFTRKLLFGVISTDKSYTRTYEVCLNVRKVFPDSLLWSEPDTVGFPVLSGISTVVRDDTVYCFGIDTTGTMSVSFRPITTGAWNGANAMSGLPLQGWQHKVAVCGGLFHTVSDGSLYVSADGLNWSVEKTGIKSLIASGSDYGVLWVVTQDSIIKCDEMGWTSVQPVPEQFPDTAAIMFTYPLATNPNLSRSVLVGLSSDTLYVSVWTIMTGDTLWTRVETPAKVNLRLPAAKDISVFRYGGALFCAGQGFNGFRQSNDNGITWYKCERYAEDYSSWNRYMQLPAALVDCSAGFDVVTDSKGYIWITTNDGRVWRGSINRYIRH